MSSEFYNDKGYNVKPRSAEIIRKTADKVRCMAEASGFVDAQGKIDIVRLLENSAIPYEILPKEDMPKTMGLARPDGSICIREDVYERACSGEARDRFTIAHEIGHIILHRDEMGAMARKADTSTKVYCNSEWQANEFAGFLLIPNTFLLENREVNAQNLSDRFGVSAQCAEIRIKKTLN